MNASHLDIVLPCYNPPANWLDELVRFHRTVPESWTINYIVVNDGSGQDAVQDLEKAPAIKGLSIKSISYSKNMGKGYALRRGVEASTAQFVLYTDVDFPFTTESMLRMISALFSEEFDVLAGSRDSSYYQNKMSAFRKLLSLSFRFLLKRILRMKIEDTQCGLKAFNKKGKEKFLKTRVNRYLFDFEFIYLCSKDRFLKIAPVPVELKANVTFSRMRPRVVFQESLNLLKVIFSR